MVDNTINKELIAEEIALDLGVSKAQSQEMINDIIDIMIDHVFTHQKFKIPYFGTFTIHNKVPRIGRNPKTKQEYEIPARQLIAFKAAEAFRDFVNDNNPDN
jgi:integration host factor subunit alpha